MQLRMSPGGAPRTLAQPAGGAAVVGDRDHPGQPPQAGGADVRLQPAEERRGAGTPPMATRNRAGLAIPPRLR